MKRASNPDVGIGLTLDVEIGLGYRRRIETGTIVGDLLKGYRNYWIPFLGGTQCGTPFLNAHESTFLSFGLLE